MDAYNDPPVMTSQTGTRAKDHSPKKPVGKNFHHGTPALDALAEHSLSGFLESEPDLYTISDTACGTIEKKTGGISPHWQRNGTQ